MGVTDSLRIGLYLRRTIAHFCSYIANYMQFDHKYECEREKDCCIQALFAVTKSSFHILSQPDPIPNDRVRSRSLFPRGSRCSQKR